MDIDHLRTFLQANPDAPLLLERVDDRGVMAVVVTGATPNGDAEEVITLARSSEPRWFASYDTALGVLRSAGALHVRVSL